VSRKNAEAFFAALERELTAPAAEPVQAAEAPAAAVHPGRPVEKQGTDFESFLRGVAVGVLLTAIGVVLGRRR
jgi:hypothetical protein